MSQRQKQAANEKRTRRLGTGEGIARDKRATRGGGGGGDGTPSWMWIVGLIVLVAVGGGAVYAFTTGDDGGEALGQGERTEVVLNRLSDEKINLVSQGTWQPNYTDLAAAMDALNLPGLSETIQHYHVHVRVIADGQEVPIPTNVGIDQVQEVASPIHTHDERGVIHVEADQEGFLGTLQQVFDIWGVRLTDQCLGGFCDGVAIYVNGEPVDDPGYVLQAHDAVTVVAGTPPDGFEPDPTFDFAPGE